ncbi:beta strand repeat-containing protein [Gluconacetobacter diazotrophicus]|uniref:Putative Hemolysin-type calcium-binding n=1 Tax=Gluconacetobacter diazotrophicus (strain ATCC 49037 / DSM 5601 / CCUG 37298 / CIP 103539 / LMG 7603 / PAl5) TaxID=272568 RepID=A9HBV9_GLUDA|nr:calcium-binding protein [Gluconacetobacter diazotrophicus]CAP54864.1 putative Hemolysin-type calcium-binding [Gluconacetobacter diazotrophicus PA1 5]
MAIVTVMGASGASVNVTVDGGDTLALANAYARTLQDTAAGKSFATLQSGINMAGGGNAAAVITVGGAYALEGAYVNIVAGALSQGMSGNILTSHVDISTLGVTTPVDVIAGTTGGTTFLGGDAGGSFLATAGDNVVIGTDGDFTIDTAAGNDLIDTGSGNDTVNAGSGDNQIYLGSGSNSVASMGQDTIVGDTGTQAVTIYGGNSLIVLGDAAAITDQAAGSTISVGGGSTVSGGTQDLVNFTGATGTISGAVADTISAAGDLQVRMGVGNSISVTGSLTFLNGTGMTTVTAAQATIFGGADLDMTVNASGRTLFVANTGNETLDGAASSMPLHAFADGGDATFIGGAGNDTLVGGTGSATMTGGAGDNLFAFTKGPSSGGDNVITDFGSSAGNLAALYQYGYQNGNGLQAVLDSATVAGGNSTIQLSDSTKITFMGVTDLKASDFTLS